MQSAGLWRPVRTKPPWLPQRDWDRMPACPVCQKRYKSFLGRAAHMNADHAEAGALGHRVRVAKGK